MKKLTLFLMVFVLCLACKTPEVQPEDENELITTVKLNFVEGGNTQTFIYQDTDGDGGKAPARFDEILLKANTTYTLTIQLLDESKNPASELTKEVENEKDEHLFVYTPSPSTLLTYTYGDMDSKKLPVGLTGSIRTSTLGTGTLKVQLRHQPEGLKNGSPMAGSDDVNLDFRVVIN